MPVIIHKKLNSCISFHVDTEMSFKHGKTGDVVSIKQHYKTNGNDDSGAYKILGVDVQFPGTHKTIILKNVVTGQYLECCEGQWVSQATPTLLAA